MARLAVFGVLSLSVLVLVSGHSTNYSGDYSGDYDDTRIDDADYDSGYYSGMPQPGVWMEPLCPQDPNWAAEICRRYRYGSMQVDT